jgi:hypothetical protein
MKEVFVKIDEAEVRRAEARLRAKYPNYPREGEDDMPLMGAKIERPAAPEEIERFRR